MMRRRIGIVMLIVCGTLSALGTLVWIRQRNMAVYQRASAEAQSRAVDRDREAAGTTLAPDVAEALKTFEANLAFDHSGALLLTTVRPPGAAAAKDANQYHLLIYDLAHPVESPHVLVSCDAPSAAWDTSAAAVYALQQRDGQDRLVKLEVDGRAVAESPQFPLARRGQHGALSYSRSAALVACVQPVEGAQFLILWWPGSGVLKRASLPSPFVAAPNTPPCISGDGSQVAGYIGGGGVRPCFRHRGVVRMVSHFAQELKKRGIPLLLAHANEKTSAPIMRRLGFREYGKEWIFVFSKLGDTDGPH